MKNIILAALALAIILASCTSADIQDLPPRPDYSSSSADVQISSSSSSFLPSEPSEGDSSSSEASSSSSLEPALPSSSSVQLQQSSSSLLPSMVFCIMETGCQAISKSVCDAFGTEVSGCPTGGGSSSSGLCADFVNGIEREHHGMKKMQFCDERDGTKYVYKTIGSQVWMAENLNYIASSSKCYSNSESNCTTYGRLYDWATALSVCPTGWHLPSREEWNVLSSSVGGSSVEGRHLKAKSGWESNGGLDTYGFTALPGGRGAPSGNFSDIDKNGRWWSSEERDDENAYLRRMQHDVDSAGWYYTLKDYFVSVRCIRGN
jgi:uncharacterized protein (TIGR02145 family)